MSSGSSISPSPLKTCPKCKKKGVKRLVGGGAGLIFKGTGFYITDYKNKGTKKDGGGESKSTETKPSSDSKSSSSSSSPSTGSSGSSSSGKSSDSSKK